MTMSSSNILFSCILAFLVAFAFAAPQNGYQTHSNEDYSREGLRVPQMQTSNGNNQGNLLNSQSYDDIYDSAEDGDDTKRSVALENEDEPLEKNSTLEHPTELADLNSISSAKLDTEIANNKDNKQKRSAENKKSTQYDDDLDSSFIEDNNSTDSNVYNMQKRNIDSDGETTQYDDDNEFDDNLFSGANNFTNADNMQKRDSDNEKDDQGENDFIKSENSFADAQNTTDSTADDKQKRNSDDQDGSTQYDDQYDVDTDNSFGDENNSTNVDNMQKRDSDNEESDNDNQYGENTYNNTTTDSTQGDLNSERKETNFEYTDDGSVHYMQKRSAHNGVVHGEEPAEYDYDIHVKVFEKNNNTSEEEHKTDTNMQKRNIENKDNDEPLYDNHYVAQSGESNDTSILSLIFA